MYEDIIKSKFEELTDCRTNISHFHKKIKIAINSSNSPCKVLKRKTFADETREYKTTIVHS